MRDEIVHGRTDEEGDTEIVVARHTSGAREREVERLLMLKGLQNSGGREPPSVSSLTSQFVT